MALLGSSLVRQVTVLMPLLGLCACEPPQVPALAPDTLLSTVTAPHAPVECKPTADPEAEIAGALARGEPAEASPAGACLKRQADAGDAKAALTLGDAYFRADGNPEAPRALDLHGRAVRWYRQAARQGWGLAELRLAQALDTDHDIQIPGSSLAYFQLAAAHRQDHVWKDLARAYARGRINDTDTFALREALNAHAAHDPAWKPYRAMLDLTPEKMPK